jgi:HSP20 family molecular chaperone IbpA
VKSKKLKMKNRRIISDELLHSIDVLNTLNGGLSEPILNLQQHEDYREIKCTVPGLQSDSLQVDVHNNFLSIHYRISIQSDGKEIQVPRIIYNKPIPYFVDVSKISANVEDGFLRVVLPFNELANGYHKRILLDN